jgi:deoxyribose-phosphate aldolase
MTLIKIDEITTKDIAKVCDHTFLKRPESFASQAKKEGKSSVMLFRQALNEFLKETVNMKTKPYAICVRPEEVRNAFQFLQENECENIKVASVVGFPDGGYDNEIDVAETRIAIRNGAKEIDMVLDYEQFKKENFGFVRDNIKAIVEVAHKHNAIVKVILETSELTEEDIKKICGIANEVDVDFVKTSTGFSASGAKPENLKIMRENFQRGVKMSGGVKPENIKELLKAASGRGDGMIELDPMKVRIGESGLLKGEDSY